MANKSEFFARVRSLQFRANQARRWELRARLDEAMRLYTDGAEFSAGEILREVEAELSATQAAHK